MCADVCGWKCGCACGCECAMLVTQAVALQSDSPAGLTNHGFNALNSNAVEGKALETSSIAAEQRLRPTVAHAEPDQPRLRCAQLQRGGNRGRHLKLQLNWDSDPRFCRPGREKRKRHHELQTQQRETHCRPRGLINHGFTAFSSVAVNRES